MKIFLLLFGILVGLVIGWVVVERYFIAKAVTEPLTCPEWLMDSPQEACSGAERSSK